MQGHCLTRFSLGIILGFSQVLSDAGIPTQAQELFAPWQSSDTGIQFKDSPSMNQGKLVTTHVSGESTPPGSCNGPLYVPSPFPSIPTYATWKSYTKAWFVSQKVPPAPGLRVLIRNTTKTIDQSSTPYTDREYDQGDRSESFTVEEGTSHNNRYLAVVPGWNSFSYQIQRGNEIVESGSFDARIDSETKSIKRERTTNLASPAQEKACLEQYKEQQRLEEEVQQLIESKPQ